jgi:uncharacterized SAM-binding protein YcdF (DUF218 family)
MIEDPTRPEAGSPVWRAAEVVWAFHQLGHAPGPAEVVIALGCHDIAVADVAADLHLSGLAPLIVATGGDNASTRALLGGGEALVYRDRMIARGVPTEAILVEQEARHTGENFTNSRDLLAAEGIKPRTALTACMPYMERRAWATCRSQWPEVELQCVSSGGSLGEYLDLMWRRDALPAETVLANIVGDLDRIWRYPALGFAIEQPQPPETLHAFRLLVDAGYGTKLL